MEDKVLDELYYPERNANYRPIPPLGIDLWEHPPDDFYLDSRINHMNYHTSLRNHLIQSGKTEKVKDRMYSLSLEDYTGEVTAHKRGPLIYPSEYDAQWSEADF